MVEPTTGGIESLPIEEVLGEIVANVRESRPVVVKAPPGAGKTTRVPPALLEVGVAGPGQILIVQPRRLAARAAAHRLAGLLGEPVGRTAGYHVRFDRKSSHGTRLLAMTPGILLRRLQSDPLLENVGCVILDEFHERSLELDVALGMVQRIRSTLRPELRVIVMSATLDPGPIVEFLGDASGVVSEGRSHPVELRYAPDHLSRRVEESVVALLPEALRETAGHLLVFLPGVGEIRRTGKAIRNRGLDRGVEVLELYGDLSPADQDRVVAPSESRKIVLATNVAETSVTIPGVTGVIDSGQARVLRYDPQVGLPRLEVEAISRASADQRSGRAGRTAPGICWRLWPAAVGRSRPQRDDPEIVRGDFSGAALTLISWGERDLDAFPWLTPPRSESVTAATELLERLGAITPDRSLTETGAAMNRLPLHPRLARFLIEAVRRDVAREASLAAALLTERDPFRPSGGNAGDAGGGTVVAMGECDLTERVERLERYREGERPVGVAAAAARNVLRVADRLWHECQRLPAFDESVGGGDRSERLRQCLLRAYPDRLARRRSPRSDRGRMIGGRGVQLRPESFVRRSELFLCIDIGSATGRGDATVRIASAIEPQWLEEDRIREVSEPFFHPTRRAVVKRRRRYVDDLVLDESPVPCEPDEATAALLHAEALRRWDEVFPADDAAVQGFVARVAFLREHAPELALDPLDRGALEQVLRSLCWGCTSLAELRRTAWLEHLKARYDYEQHRLIDREAPPRVTVPSGNTIAVRYAAGKPPVMEVRIQELFGWRETPRVAKGRVAIRLHLLGPNGRPQQITDDLENFWNRTYHEVRKELRGRYPKHHWPEDPLEAQATRNGLKPKPAK